jgi:hypothetical protein
MKVGAVRRLRGTDVYMLRRVAIGSAPFGSPASGGASRLPNVGTRGAIARDAMGLFPFSARG